MPAINLPEELEHKLEHLAQETGRSKSHYACQAIELFLNDHEECLLAASQLEKKQHCFSFEEMDRFFGLND